MINIISNIANMNTITGPTKVLNNTIKGLDLLGYPYVINAALNSTKRIWIQSGWDALPYLNKISAHVVVGPNTALYPSDLDQFDLSKAIYLQPGPTAVDFWLTLGFNQCPLKYWAAGIDTNLFRPDNSIKKDIVLVYHKHRDLEELAFITSTLARKGIEYILIPYGAYTESEYIHFLRRARYVIWHGRLESQGIALQEALSCDVPMIVCDVTTIGQSKHSRTKFPDNVKKIPATSVPYFSTTCGLKITELAELSISIENMESNLRIFSPREFIVNNLSLEIQAEKLVKIWEYWGLSLSQGKNERLKINRPFKVPVFDRLSKRIFSYMQKGK